MAINYQKTSILADIKILDTSERSSSQDQPNRQMNSPSEDYIPLDLILHHQQERAN